MPEQVKQMLQDLKENGADKDIKVLGAGVDAILDILIEDRAEAKQYRKEREAKELEMHGELREHILDPVHTPTGMLVRKNVITVWIVGTSVILGLVTHAPEIFKWVISVL
jgi:hypothetical protein